MVGEELQSLQLRIRGQAYTGDAVVCVCYRPLNQEEQADETFSKQLEKALQSHG